MDQKFQHPVTQVGCSSGENPLPFGELIPLSKLPAYIPPARNGRKRHPSSVFRYVQKGVGGVRLEARRLPNGLYTSLAAWDRFVARLSGASQYNCSELSQVPAKKHRIIEAEIETLRASMHANRAEQTQHLPSQKEDHKQCYHSSDFRSVRWELRRFSFTPTQAACVRVLWEAWEKGTPELGQETILDQAGSNGSRLRDVFKSKKRKMHDAWGTMIVQGHSNGSFCLVLGPLDFPLHSPRCPPCPGLPLPSALP